MYCNSAQGSQAEHESHKQDDSNCQIIDIDTWPFLGSLVQFSLVLIHTITLG